MLIFIHRISRAGTCIEQRKPDRKSCSLTLALTLCADRAAVYFNKMSRDRESETESAMLPSRRAVSLTKAIETRTAKTPC